MPDETRIRQLLEEILDSERTPEEVCGDFPDLLPVVRERWRNMRAVEAEVEALFPAPGPADEAKSSRRRRSLGRLGLDGELPRIPGYQIESVLGSGGMGIVYKARHLKLNRTVAIKMLLAGVYAAPEELACLMREAQAVAGLRHGHIVQVYDVADLDGLPYFTMEFLEGGNLAKKLAGTPQPAREAAALVATLAGAVEAAHKGGIVHRDLKPANILLTADGTPKITDFGLARRFEGGPALTMSSAMVGTPSYMAPEQAVGKAGAFCPSVDIYALGALLYEVLTGRPPFRAETPAETQRQVIAEEPAPPSRLNAQVPKDLETICLKCLQKEPAGRYATAAGLADDLDRFLRGEPISARRAGLPERAVKWVRRRPAQATAIAAGALVVFTLLLGGSWLGVQRARVSRAVADDLGQVENFQALSKWPEARSALERAKARLGEGGPAELRERVGRSQRDLELVARFDRIRLNRAAVVDGHFDRRANNAAADREYAGAFQEAGLSGGDQEDASVVAARVGASNIRGAIIVALDDWTACNSGANSRRRQGRLLEVARRADPDPTGWRDRVRDPKAWNDGGALVELAAVVPDTEHSLSLLLALGERLGEHAADAIPFLKRVQREHPSDFWANFSLALAIGDTNPGEAARYLQAAVAIRPDAGVARTDLGVALAQAGQLDDAIEQLERAIVLDPTLAFAHNDLGNALLLKGRPAEAIDQYRRALFLDPRSDSAHNNLGKALAETGRIDEAIDQFKAALEINPEMVAARTGLGLLLLRKGRLDEALDQCEHAVRLDPTDVGALVNLSLVLKAKGRLAESVDLLERALTLSPDHAAAHYNLGLALMAMGRTDEAAAEYNQALRIRPAFAGAHHGLGVIAGESGDLDGAIVKFRKALEIDPAHAVSSGAIGRAMMVQGRFGEARPAFQRFLDSLTTDDERYAVTAGFIRQCDRMIELDGRLEAVLKGDDKPRDGVECLQFAELCRSRRKYAGAARFYADAFDASPALAKNLGAGNRYNAACCAALAADGRDAGAPFGEGERRQWRDQARQWLSADLALWTRIPDIGEPASVTRLRQVLANWRADPDLSAIREPAALARLSPDEREQWRLLWAEVGALIQRVQGQK